MQIKILITALLNIGLLGCGAGSPEGAGNNATPAGAANTTAAPNPSPCIAASCATKTTHLHIFDAENLAFSADGRLFVSGQGDVYEITKDGAGNLQSNIVSSTACNYTGLTVRGTTLYAACFDNRLFAADINALPLSLIYTVAPAGASNGLTHLGNHLYVTDGPISPTPRINQLNIDTGNPLNITSHAPWTGFGELTSANGIQTVNGEIWVTDSNSIIRYQVDSAGNKGTSSTVLAHSNPFPAPLDDFTALTDGNIVITDTNNGVHLYSPNGVLLESESLAGPSSAIQGQGPMFNTWDIIVTEKGTLNDSTVGNGNRLAIFTAN